jgi:hypothetical protein
MEVNQNSSQNLAYITNQPDVPLFSLDQDHIAIEKLSALRTRLRGQNLSRSKSSMSKKEYSETSVDI